MRHEEVKVSIILPIYNVGEFFGTCMESVLKQSHRNLEIILVDDGSTDDSGLIADGYAKRDSRIRVIHQENKGVSTARNVGIDAATGEYVCFSDSDDILEQDYVEYLLNLCMEKGVNVAVCAEVFTPFKRVQPNENIRVVTGEDAAAEILYGRITVGCYSKMYSRPFLNENGIRFFEDVSIGEGFNFNVLSFCTAPQVAISQHKVYYYRLNNSESAMTLFNIKKCEIGINAISIIRDKLVIRSKKLLRAVDFAEYNTVGSMFEWMVMAGATKSYPEYYSQWERKLRHYSWKVLFAHTSRKTKIAIIIRAFSPFMWAYARKIARRLVIKNNPKNGQQYQKKQKIVNGGGNRTMHRLPCLRTTVYPPCHLHAA